MDISSSIRRSNIRINLLVCTPCCASPSTFSQLRFNLFYDSSITLKIYLTTPTFLTSDFTGSSRLYFKGVTCKCIVKLQKAVAAFVVRNSLSGTANCKVCVFLLFEHYISFPSLLSLIFTLLIYFQLIILTHIRNLLKIRLLSPSSHISDNAILTWHYSSADEQTSCFLFNIVFRQALSSSVSATGSQFSVYFKYTTHLG